MIFFLTCLKVVSTTKHWNSVTIFKLSNSVQLGCKINLLIGCVPASQAEVDLLNIITELSCLLGLTLLSVQILKNVLYQVYSILGGTFKENSASAFAIFKFMQSFAAAIAFWYSPLLKLYWQLLIAVVLDILGTIAFCTVEWKRNK